MLVSIIKDFVIVFLSKKCPFDRENAVIGVVVFPYLSKKH